MMILLSVLQHERIKVWVSGVIDYLESNFQVEYYFSDLNLATTDHLMRFISKDPEGYGKFLLLKVFRRSLLHFL